MLYLPESPLTLELSELTHIRAQKAILVAVFVRSQDGRESGIYDPADPSMYILPSVEQFAGEFLMPRFRDAEEHDYQKVWALVAVPDDQVLNLMVDGVRADLTSLRRVSRSRALHFIAGAVAVNPSRMHRFVMNGAVSTCPHQVEVYKTFTRCPIYFNELPICYSLLLYFRSLWLSDTEPKIENHLLQLWAIGSMCLVVKKRTCSRSVMALTTIATMLSMKKSVATRKTTIRTDLSMKIVKVSLAIAAYFVYIVITENYCPMLCLQVISYLPPTKMRLEQTS